ncbi:MAG: glycosyltransferase family 4 protein [Calditrichaceae bacterium]|nr:glycosyltransferase family 4 protein [Calditrichaceae bacterium]
MKKTMLFISFEHIEFRRRVLNQIETAQNMGFNVRVISISKYDIINQKHTFDYSAISLPDFFKHGIIAYPVFNFILLIKIIFKKYDVIHFRGIIPIPALLIRQWFNKSALIYDAHEYFRGHQIFENRPIRRAVWMWFEQKIVYCVHTLITVSEPLAELFKRDYPDTKAIRVIRSLPSLNSIQTAVNNNNFVEKRVIFHGYFLPGRALINIIQAAAIIKDDSIKFLLIGTGPLEKQLKNKVSQLKLDHKIRFHPLIENEQLIGYISAAKLGLVLSEPDSINRTYALPNKFFEYIHAGLPVLAGNIPTLQHNVDHYQVGQTVDPSDIKAIAQKIELMLADESQLTRWRKNCAKAALELNWEKESEKLKQIYSKLL